MNKSLGHNCYQWLLFDADGTLFDYDRAEGLALRATFDAMAVPFDDSCLSAYRQINNSCWSLVESGELRPADVKLRRFELLLQTLNLDYPPSAFSATYLRCLAARAELMDHAEEVLRALRTKYQLAILTNGLQDVQRGRLARSIIQDCISELIISEEIGFAKPAPGFFAAAFSRLGNPPKHSVLMIGDGWASDITGAVQYGLDACWFNPHRKPRPAHPPITCEIASLRDLLPWLG